MEETNPSPADVDVPLEDVESHQQQENSSVSTINEERLDSIPSTKSNYQRRYSQRASVRWDID